eukprot:2376190-Rhodomonas_salina.2
MRLVSLGTGTRPAVTTPFVSALSSKRYGGRSATMAVQSATMAVQSATMEADLLELDGSLDRVLVARYSVREYRASCCRPVWRYRSISER